MGESLKNFLLYNVGWFACVFSAASGHPWVGVTAVALVAAAHLLSMTAWRQEMILLGVAAAVGFAWESALLWLSVIEYPTAPGMGSFAPLWIVALWVNFATTINVSLAWVKRSAWLAAGFGAIGGPLAFLAGQKLGAVTFPELWVSMVAIGAGWTVLLPMLCRVADVIAEANDEATAADPSPTLVQQAQMLLTGKGLPK